jgi:N-methylhydantoinase B/oxoprolinase/acetone carboxylase alpha subunit
METLCGVRPGMFEHARHLGAPGRLASVPDMTHTLETPMAKDQEKTGTRRRRSRTARSSDVKSSSATRRGPGVRQATESVVADLDRMISALIKENRDLQRQIDKLSRQAISATSGTAERTLRSIQRRISGAVDGGGTTRRRRSVVAAQVSRTPRKVTDPEVLERRRQALAKAREARAAKRAGA